MRKTILSLFLGLGCLAATPAALVNGGLIVFHGYAHWTHAANGPTSFIVVVEDNEFGRLRRRLQTDNYADTVRLIESGTDMKLAALDSQRLSGHLLDSGRRVLVITQSYAVRHPAL